MRGKPCFFVHSGTVFIAPPCTWLVPMTCCSYGVQDSKKSGRNSLFPEASFIVLYESNRAPVVAPPYFVSIDTANSWSHLEFGSSGYIFRKIILFAGTLTAASVGFPKFFCERTARPNQRNRENYMKENCSCRGRTRSKFCHISLSVQTPNP